MTGAGNGDDPAGPVTSGGHTSTGMAAGDPITGGHPRAGGVTSGTETEPGPVADAAGDERVTLKNLPWAITDDREPSTLPPWFRRAVTLVLVLWVSSRVILWAFGELSSFWFTLFLAFFFGLAMEPAVNWMAARGIRRGVGTFIVMGGLLMATVIFFAVFGSLLATQLAELIRGIPGLLDSVIEWVNQRFGTTFSADKVLKEFGIASGDIAKVAANLGLGLLGWIGQAVGWVFSGFTILLFSFYFAAEGPHFRRAVASWLTPDKQRTFLTVWDISTQKAGGYVISRGVMAVISAAFHGTVFALLGLPYWLPMALWVGLVSQFIPTIGTYLAGLLPIVIALVNGSPTTALIVLVAVVVYQQIENYFVQPRITKSTLEIHPAVAFGSVIAGSALFGAIGALLAIPVVATVQAVIASYGRRYALVAEFGADAGATDLERVEAAMRAADDGFRPGH